MTAEQAQRNIALAEALESGKYEQGRGRLREEGRFCCLGVACDLVNPDGWQMSDFGYKFRGEGHVATLEIKALYGWPDVNPNLPGFEEATDNGAAALNDEGKSFPEIAKGFRLLAAQEYEGEAK